MKAVILGAGAGGKLYLDVLNESPESRDVEVIGFIDDAPELKNSTASGLPVLGGYAELPELVKRHNIEGVLVAYSDRFMRLRGERFTECLEIGLRPLNAIHSTAVIAPSVTIGDGVFIGRGVLIDLETRLGNACSVHRGCGIGEYCILEENVWLGGGVNLAGSVSVGKNTMIGTGASVIPKCHIGRDAIVGAGAVVIGDVPEGVTVVGVPARIIKKREG